MASSPPPREPSLDGPEAAETQHGRVGYGFYGRWTPVALAAVLIATLLAIGIYDQQQDPDDTAPIRSLRAGAQAPDVTLNLLNGETLNLASLRGEIVILNFWASWCEPCRAEAPLLQEISEVAVIHGRPVRVVGVGLKADNTSAARDFVDEFDLTYPIGRDTGESSALYGPIQRAFQIPDSYPATVFIDQAGDIAGVHTGELTSEIIVGYVDQIPMS